MAGGSSRDHDGFTSFDCNPSLRAAVITPPESAAASNLSNYRPCRRNDIVGRSDCVADDPLCGAPAAAFMSAVRSLNVRSDVAALGLITSGTPAGPQTHSKYLGTA
jgi:hypothetical protein